MPIVMVKIITVRAKPNAPSQSINGMAFCSWPVACRQLWRGVYFQPVMMSMLFAFLVGKVFNPQVGKLAAYSAVHVSNLGFKGCKVLV